MNCHLSACYKFRDVVWGMGLEVGEVGLGPGGHKVGTGFEMDLLWQQGVGLGGEPSGQRAAVRWQNRIGDRAGPSRDLGAEHGW